MQDLRHERKSGRQPQTERAQTQNTTAPSNEAALARLDQALSDARLPLQRDRAVTEKQALDSLRICFDLARMFNEIEPEIESLTPAMKALFVVDDKLIGADRIQATVQQAMAINGLAIDRIADTAHRIVVDPKVYITEEILKMYVVFKGYLDRPEDLGDVFHLYANKPAPVPDSSPIQYKPASPGQASAAVPIELAHAALDAAINVRNLSLALNIVDKTVCTKAFRTHKLLSQALVPSAGVAIAPFAAYAIASQFAIFQDHLTTSNARWVGFAGITSYLLFTGTIGFVALATSNDQMHRVTWANGLPLRQRWMREPERAMMDKIACAWGLKNKERWGEEEGPDWTALKELIRLRGMWLDRVELMEGMS